MIEAIQEWFRTNYGWWLVMYALIFGCASFSLSSKWRFRPDEEILGHLLVPFGSLLLMVLSIIYFVLVPH